MANLQEVNSQNFKYQVIHKMIKLFIFCKKLLVFTTYWYQKGWNSSQKQRKYRNKDNEEELREYN